MEIELNKGGRFNLSKEVLYERLLNEFPSWMKQARSKGILS
ncbi:MAG: hypothetical protein V7K30_12950 [Nostoc sp.]